MRSLILLGIALSLAGCGVMAIDKAKKEYDASRAAYKACLASHPIEQCRAQKAAMDADAKNWLSMKYGGADYRVGVDNTD